MLALFQAASRAKILFADGTFIQKSNKAAGPHMAIDLDTVDFILSARRVSAKFTSTLTLGKQDLALDRAALRILLHQYGIRLGFRSGGFADTPSSIRNKPN
jgi:hypothetical protein